MMRLAAGLSALFAATLAHAAGSTASSSSTAVATTLEPDKPYEACMSLAAGEKRRWYWRSDAPVDFNIHFRAETLAYSVKRERMRGDGGTFTAKDAGTYCWMWSAPKPAKLEAKIQP